MSNRIRRILHGLHKQHIKGKNVEICLVPGHAGLPGNEEAVVVAKGAALHPEEYVTISYTD